MSGAPPTRHPETPVWRFVVPEDHKLADCATGVCDAHDGLTLSDDDPFWRTHTPPLHWNCGCVVEQYPEAVAPPRSSPEDVAKVPPAFPGFGDGTTPDDPPPGTLDMSTIHRAPGIAILFDATRPPTIGHTTWNQVARLGEFRGHPQGAFAFTPEVFRVLCENFAATENGRIPVDYEHTSEVHPDNAAQEGVPAVAWVTALDDRGSEGLWGAFEWVDAQAVEYVRARRYLYLSPAVRFDATHRETGEKIGPRLTSVALTNHPFLDGMAPLTASDAAPSDTTRCGLAPDAVHIPIGTQSAPPEEPSMTDEETAAAAKKTLDDDAAAAAMSAHAEMSAHAARYSVIAPKLRAMSATMGLGAEASEDALLDALAHLVDAMRAAQEAEASTMADAVCASGRVALAGKDDVRALYLGDRPRFTRLFGDVKPGAPAAVVSPDARVLLTERIASDTQPPAPPPAADASDLLASSREADRLATKLLGDKAAPDYATALDMAGRTMRERRLSDVLSRLPASAAR